MSREYCYICGNVKSNGCCNHKESDKLDEFFKLQKEFQDSYGYWPELYQVCSAGASEFLELWAKAGGKWWKKHESSKEDQKDELADILHFFLIACLKLEISPEELFDVYKAKLGINYKRQKNGY